jgi:hypothetical protein
MIATIFISIYVTFIIAGLIYVIFKREKYLIEKGFLITSLIYFSSEITYFILFNLSAENFFGIPIALFLWYFSIIARVISIGMFATIHNLELNKDSRVRLLPALLYIFLGGVTLSFLFLPNSFTVISIRNEYYYFFSNVGLLTSIILYSLSIVFITWLIQIKEYKNYADKKLGKYYDVLIIFFSLNIIFYCLLIISPHFSFKLLHSVFYLLGFGYFVYIVINKPNLFAVFTNKIYDFIIFHKSGILLYSYNFQTRKEIDENLLKGSILIGISHILANLSNLKAQVTHIKMEERAVVFNFNTQLGYVILLIAKHKNKILETSIESFDKEFSTLNMDSLKSISGLIDVSQFKNAKALIQQYFRHFITEK